MQSFAKYSIVQERFLNLFNDDRSEREKYAREVFALLNNAYRKVGGIQGNGFRSEHDMVENIPFWKLVRKNDKIVTAVMYKDKNGRKMVAAGTDFSDEGKEALAVILLQDLNPVDKHRFKKGSRAYFEVSGGALKFLINSSSYEFIQSFASMPHEVKQILTDDDILPVQHDDKEVKAHPELKRYFYQREIGGNLHTKILLGVTENAIM